MNPAVLARLARSRRVRRLLLTLAAINAAAILIVPVVILGLLRIPLPTPPAGTCANPGPVTMIGSKPGPAGLSAIQQSNAKVIVTVGRSMRVPTVGLTDAISTALAESGLVNLDHGDRDSLGLFQQRPSMGWGTPAQIMNPAYAAGRFYRALLAVPGWQAMAPGVADQAVQGSALPDRYAQFWSQAQAIVGKAGGPTTPTDCGQAVPSGKVTDHPPANVTNAWVGQPWPVGMCQDYVRSKLSAPYGAPTAIAAWGQARLKHPGDPAPPAMVPVYFRGGSTGAGHAALSAGGGWIFSTDWPTAGRVGEVKITTLAATWHETYLGWTGDINGKVVHR